MGFSIDTCVFANDSNKTGCLRLSVILQIDFKTKSLSRLEISKALLAKVRDSKGLETKANCTCVYIVSRCFQVR